MGVRTVCLFRSDLEKLDKAIRSSFIVESIDDKINDSVDIFGYMSTHYVCKIKDEYVGPRYDRLKGLRFEIQTRTLCMHAWAAVSHYLSYKGEWDVPAEHRKAINALSGLFYIADNEFEASYQVRERSLVEAQDEIQHGQLADTEINLDTVSAYMRQKFPKRRQYGASYSSFVKELIESGYATIAEVNGDIDSAVKAFSRYEAEHPPTSGDYADLGVARLSLAIASKRFYDTCKGKLPHDIPQYRKYLLS